ncbi:hypothetical protein OG453_37805 [Streptomyces sp. NBC_01381]|uniref:hypothetical protein n=1 Tax=Streptomyces sp. NBC_01381 TaxID=2903845 RepID=UPI00225262D6|nr:hypothetical protein [Streptomyces sp. NBC_01381]MCX4672354.1 hypothetical protein [Streptomyces sp. NBC_01381]
MTDYRHSVADYADQRAELVKRVAEHIEQSRQEHQRKGMVFTSVTPEQLQHKLERTNSPMIVSQGWSGSAPVGGTLSYTVGISNPDPVDRGSLFVHLFIGPANIAPDVSESVSAVDPRFPRLTKPGFAGLVVKAGAFEHVEFTIPVPTVEKSNYLGNSFLFQSTWHDPGTYLDRSLFVFEVT